MYNKIDKSYKVEIKLYMELVTEKVRESYAG